MDNKHSVTQLNARQWLVNLRLSQWPKHASEWKDKATHRFKCGGLNAYKLSVSYSCSSFKYIFEALTSETENGPIKVSAIVNGVMADLQRVWAAFFLGSVKHECQIDDAIDVKDINTSHTAQLPSIQALLEFKDPSRAPLKETNGEKQILDNFTKVFEIGLLSDIVCVVQGQKIKAHSIVVAAGSPVFAAMFQEGTFKEAQTKTVIIEDVEAEVFRDLLRYLYTGAVQFNEMTESLFLAADKYQVDSLKTECESYLSSNLSVENAVRCLVLGHLYSSSELLEEAIEFIVDNREEVLFRPEWKELFKNYPELFFTVTQKMVVEFCFQEQ